MDCRCGHDSARHSGGYCKACPSRCRQFEASVDGLERTLITPAETGKVFSAPDGKDYIISGDATVVPAEQSEVYQKWLGDQLEKQRASYEASAHPHSWLGKIMGTVFAVVLMLIILGPVSSAITESTKGTSFSSATQTVVGVIPLMCAVTVLLMVFNIGRD